jgi:hypothetical protein
MRDSSLTLSWVGFLLLFASVQAILAGSAIVTYKRLGHATDDWTFFPMTSTPEASRGVPPILAKGLRVLRGGAIGSMLLLCAPLLPWRWLETPTVLFLVVPLFAPFLLILWRLRYTPRKDGLALALGTGGVLLSGMGLLLAALATSSRFDWGILLWLALLTASQAMLAGAALMTYTRLGYARGDWKLLVRGVVDPLVFFAVMAVLISGSIGHIR